MAVWLTGSLHVFFPPTLMSSVQRNSEERTSGSPSQMPPVVSCDSPSQGATSNGRGRKKSIDEARSPRTKPKAAILQSNFLKLFSIATLASAIFWAKTSRAPGSMPASYAVCSVEGEGIYTVDNRNSRVQCIVVNTTRIIDIGDLGKFHIHQQSHLLNVTDPILRQIPFRLVGNRSSPRQTPPCSRTFVCLSFISQRAQSWSPA